MGLCGGRVGTADQRRGVRLVTLLVATRAGIWADRRVVAGSTIFRPSLKLAAAPGIVAGFCGYYSGVIEARRAVRSGETDPAAIAKLSDGLCVTEDGVIWELSDKHAQRVPRREAFVCSGTGGDEAQAFLSGAGCTPETIRKAFKYVSRVRTDCGDGCDFRGLP